MAQSVALAVLENLVHMSRQDFPTGYVRITATVGDDIAILSEGDLRGNRSLRDFSTRALGDAWLDSQPSAVLKVRSAVVPEEWNYLLNPRHPDFSRIVVHQPEPFLFDERLFHGGPVILRTLAPQENRVLWRNVTLKLSGEVGQAALAFLAFHRT